MTYFNICRKLEFEPKKPMLEGPVRRKNPAVTAVLIMAVLAWIMMNVVLWTTTLAGRQQLAPIPLVVLSVIVPMVA